MSRSFFNYFSKEAALSSSPGFQPHLSPQHPPAGSGERRHSRGPLASHSGPSGAEPRSVPGSLSPVPLPLLPFLGENVLSGKAQQHARQAWTPWSLNHDGRHARAFPRPRPLTQDVWRLKCVLWGPVIWTQPLAPPLTGCVTLGKLVHLLCLSFPSCKKGIVMPTSLGHGEK